MGKAQEDAAAQKQKDEEKRRQIQQAREDAIYNATMNAANANNSNREADNDEIDYDDDEEEMEEEHEKENKPEFSATKESEVNTPSDDKPDAMITKLSRGESLSQSGGIVQPEKMINIFEKKMNPVVEALSSLVQQFVPVESQHFDLEKYTARLKADLETK